MLLSLCPGCVGTEQGRARGVVPRSLPRVVPAVGPACHPPSFVLCPPLRSRCLRQSLNGAPASQTLSTELTLITRGAAESMLHSPRAHCSSARRVQTTCLPTPACTRDAVRRADACFARSSTNTHRRSAMPSWPRRLGRVRHQWRLWGRRQHVHADLRRQHGGDQYLSLHLR